MIVCDTRSIQSGNDAACEVQPMSIFSNIYTMIRQVLGRVIPYQNIQQVENIDTPLSQEMQIALEAWHRAYLDRPIYKNEQVKTLNIPAFIASEISRQVTLEFKWSITAGKDDSTGEDITNPRSEFLSKEFEKLATQLRSKTEIGCAAGGMTIKPYVRDGHIYFDYTPDWDLYPIAFGDDSDLSDVIDYAIQQHKTSQSQARDGEEVVQRFVSGINCNPRTAKIEMQKIVWEIFL